MARPLRIEAGVYVNPIVQRPSQRVPSIDQWQAIMAEARAMAHVAIASPTMSGSALVVRGAASQSAI